MKKIAYICNNFGSTRDGIGAYSQKFYEKITLDNDFEVVLFTSKTDNLSKLKRFLSFKMYHTIDKCIQSFQNNLDFNYILLEYPFVEYNPLILNRIKKLKKVLGNKGKLILSLHEYSRVKKLRKKIIRSIITNSDIVFVTSQKEKDILQRKFKNKSFYIRSIPSNISKMVPIENNKNAYVFFGLINSSKAFQEMIEGFKLFNKDLTKILHVITSSTVDTEGWKNTGIIFHNNLPELEIAHIFSKSQFCITPIIPYADKNNATLKTGCLYKSICIGNIEKNLLNEIGAIPMNDYSVKSFLEAFVASTKLSDVQRELLSEKSYKFGKKYSFEATIETYKDVLNKVE